MKEATAAAATGPPREPPTRADPPAGESGSTLTYPLLTARQIWDPYYTLGGLRRFGGLWDPYGTSLHIWY